MPESRSTTTDSPGGRGRELRALLAWIGQSWRRPAGSAAAWEQAAGHERATARPVASPGAGAAPAGRDGVAGAGEAPAKR